MSTQAIMVLTRTELQNQWKKSTLNDELKCAIIESGPRAAFGVYKDFIIFVRNTYRPAAVELTSEWGISNTALRACCSYYGIVVGYPPPLLQVMIKEAYAAGLTTAQCQETFRVGFAIIKKLVTPRHVEFNPTVDDFIGWYSEKRSMANIAELTGVPRHRVVRHAANLGIKYNCSLLLPTIRPLVVEGMSVVDIAQRVGVSRGTVTKAMMLGEIEYSPEHKKQQNEQQALRLRAKGQRGAEVTKARGQQTLVQHKDEVERLLYEGYSTRAIGAAIGIHEATVKKIYSFYDLSYITKNQYLRDQSRTSFDRWMATPRDGYQYTKVTFDQWRSKDKKILITCLQHGDFWQRWINHFCKHVDCPKCANSGPSKAEDEVASFVKQIVGGVVRSNRQLLGARQELDILVESHTLAIEYNGVYWHSSPTPARKNEYRHAHKTAACEKRGLRLLHVNSDEWANVHRRSTWETIISYMVDGEVEIIDCITVDSITPRDANHLALFSLCGHEYNGDVVGMYYHSKLVGAVWYTHYTPSQVCIHSITTFPGIIFTNLLHLHEVVGAHLTSGVVFNIDRRWASIFNIPPDWDVVITPPRPATVHNGSSVRWYHTHEKKFVESMLSDSTRIMYDCGTLLITPQEVTHDIT